MPEAQRNEQTPPLTTETGAYNGNSVVSVYLSFNRDDLLLPGENSEIASSESFLGRSDPLGINKCLESFVFQCIEGEDVLVYKIKLINPTTKIEEAFMSFYDLIYPEEQGVIDNWVNASIRQRTLEDTTGQATTEYAKVGRGSQRALPEIYLRWGYGNTEKSGLSRIHKTQLADIKYLIKSNQDKELELKLTDLLSYTKTSETFTNRQHTHKVSALIPTPGGSPQYTIKKPGEIIQQLIAGYIAQYPNIVPVCQLYTGSKGQNDSSFGELIDNKVFGVARAMALRSNVNLPVDTWEDLPPDPRAIGSYMAPPPPPKKDNEGRKNSTEWYDSLTEKERNRIDRDLNAQVFTQAEWAKGERGRVTESILLQAYKTCFEEIGLTFKSNLIDPQTAGKPGRTSTEQGDGIEQKGTPVGSYTQARLLNLEPEESKLTVNLYNTHMGDIHPLDPPKGDVLGHLSFWPIGLESTPPFADDRGEQVIAKIIDINTNSEAKASKRWYTDHREYYCEISNSTVPKETRTPLEHNGNSWEDTSGYVKVTFDRDISDYAIRYDGTRNADEGFPVTAGNLQCPSPETGYTTLAPDLREVPKVVFYDIEGTGELNNRAYYLYQPNNDFILSPHQAYLLSAAPEVEGVSFVYDPNLKPIKYTDVPEDLKSGSNDSFGAYVKGGKIAIADERLISNPDSTQYPRKLRKLTADEKRKALENGQAPIWLKPGVVNVLNYSTDISPTYKILPDQSRFTFSVSDLQKQFSSKTLLDEIKRSGNSTVGNLNNSADITLPRLPVTIPGPSRFPVTIGSHAYGLDFNGLGTDRATAKIPVYDINTGELLLYSKANDTYGDTLKEYTGWLDSYFTSATPINTPTVLLEPTPQTWDYLNKITRDAETEIINRRNESTTQEEIELQNVNANPTVISPPQERKLQREPDRQVWVSLGTDGIEPNITKTIQKFLSNLNNFVVGTPQKMRFSSLSFSQLTKAQQEEIIESGPLKGIDDERKKALTEDAKTLAFASVDSNIRKYTERCINRIYSFPKITDKNENVKSVIYLDYGTKDSTVMNIKFDAGIRFLMGIAQSHYINRYFADVERYFSSDKNQQQMIYKVLSNGLQDRINLLISQKNEGTEEDKKLLEQEINKAVNLQHRVTEDRNQICSDGIIDADILQLFPAFADNYTDNDLKEIVGEENVKSLRILASLVSSNGFMDNLFPNEKGLDAESLTLQKAAILSTSGAEEAEIFETTNTMNKRKIDFATAQGRLSKVNKVESLRKIMDQSFWTKEVLLDQAWEVTVDILGIPEIDIPVVEFLERNIVLRVYDSRLASQAPHWVSGLYRITGFSHKIDLSEGYITTLKLQKKLTTKLNNLAGNLEISEE